MSRIIQQIATVQFQVDNRKVTASMNALQTEAESLNGKIAAVNQNIKNLGNVPPDNKFLLEYQKQLRQLNSDLKDVTTAQRDLMKGVKAADQLWKAARTQDIESLSIKAIKAGQNGLRKRMENLRPELGGDEQKMYDAYKAVIDEADRVMNVFKSNYATVVQTIRDGGIVSEQAMKSTRDALRDLMEAEKEGTAEHRQLAQQYDFLNESLANVAEMRRREKGEIVNANDARREALKLTEDGIAAARRERDMADAVIAGMQQQKSNLEQKRKLIDDNIAQTEREIAANQRLEEAEQDRLADVEKAMRYTENEDRKEAIRLRKKADAARDEAETKKEAYEEQAEQEKLLRQHVKDTGDEVTNLTAKIEALGKTEAKPKVDTSEIERLTAELKEAQRVLGNATAFEKLAQAKLEGMRSAHATQEAGFRSKEAELRKFTDATYELQERRNELDWAIEPFSRRHRQGYNHFDVHDVEQQRVAVEKLDEAFRRLHDDEYFKNASLSRQYELLGTAAFGYSDAERQFGSYERAIRSLGVALEETGAKARLVFQGAGVDKSFQGVEFMEGYVTRRKEIAQLNSEIKKALGDTDIDALAREVEAERRIFNQGTEDLKEQEREVERRGRLKQEYADKAAEAERNLAEATKQGTAATNEESEAAQKLAGQIERRKKDLEDTIRDEQAANEELKRYGITTADVTDEVKLQAAAEKALKEEEETRLELAKQMLEVRKQVGAAELKDSRIVGTKETRAFYEKNKGILEDEWWKSEAGGGSVSRMYKYLNDISDDPEAKAEFKEQVGMSVKDAMRVAGQKMREVIQESMKRGIKIDDAMTDFEDGYGHGPATSIAEFMKEFNETINEKEKELIDKRRKDLDTIYDAVYEPGDEPEMPSREERLKEIKASLKSAAEGHYGNDTPLSENVRQQREEIAGLEEEYRKLTQTEEQSVDVAKQKAELEGQLKEKTKEHTKAVKDYEAQQEKTNKAQEKAYKAQEESVALNEKAATAEEKVAHQEEEHAEVMEHQSERLRQIRAEGERLLTQYEQQKTEIQNVDKAWADADVKQGEAEARKAQNQELTIKSLDDSIRKLKEANAVIDTNSDEWEENTRIIQRLQAALDEMKNKPALMMMTDRMQDVSKLSTAAVTETRKFWEAMVAGAERGSKELAEYEGHLKTITEEEQKRRVGQIRSQAFRVKAGLYGGMDENELRESINAAREYQKTLIVGGTLYNEYSEAIAKAEKHLRDNSVETERAKLSQQEMNDMMRQQLNQGTALTESALRTQQQYWQRLIDDPKTAAESLDLYKANLKEVQDLQQQQANELRDTRVARLDNPGNFSNLSEQEIREAIEAGKQLIQTYETGDARAKTLGENIVRAEEHLKKYGLEAERAAVREAKALEEAAKKRQESDDLMKQQLQQGASLSREALKTQEQYWKHLIDDPKTAASSLADYQYQLDRVRLLQQMMMQQEGRDAFDFFKNDYYENASADEIKRQSDALKKYRDSLPQQDNADTIQEINELLIKAGVAAQKAAGETMTFKQALRIGMDAKGGNFKGTVEQLTQAKKTLEQLQQTAVKGGLEWRRMQDGIDSINLELKRTSYLSKEVQDILDKPKGRSLNALKQAVEQGRAALQNMDRTTKDGQEAFDELAKKIKATELELKQMSGEAKATTSAFGKAWSRLKTYVGLYVGASVAMNKLTATMGDLMEISDKMGEVRKTTGFTADQVGRLSGELKKFDTRTTLNGLLDLSVAAGQLGLKTEEDVLGFTEAANKLMVALPEMGKEGATEMLKVALATGEIDKINKQMEQGLIDGSSATAVAMEKVGSTIDRLRATSAATAPAITDFVKRVGAVGAQSGISIDQVAALGSTVDALGMRVEMSATALSRMIPAIKNNAYSIGAMIGQTEEEIVRKFENGMGMNVILDIFEAIRNNSKTMTGDVEADAEQIEKEFEKAGLKEIMKELNQMGARAGIVFAGLSQNVDELRRQLGVAAEAYEENIAIEMEYQKMNETTAAKWERLKNELEETFVSDTAQRWLGGIIDFLRGIVNFISGNVNPVLKGLRDTIATIGIAWFTLFKLGIGEAIFKATGGLRNLLAAAQLYVGNVKAWIVAEWQLAVAKDAEAKATARATIAQLGWNKAMATNVILAVASALFMAYQALKGWIGGCESAKNAMSDLNEKVDEEKRNLDNLVNAYHDANGNQDKRKNLLNEINQKYSKYLGFLLTDANNSNLVAAAHERIAAALQKEMYERERAQSESKVRQDFREDLSENWQEFTDELREYGLNAEEVAQARNAIQGFLHTVSYDDSAKKFLFADGTKEGIVNYMRNEHRSINASLSDADAEEIMALWVYQYLETTFGSKLNAGALKDIVGVSMITNSAGKGWDTAKAGSEFRGDYADYYTDMLEQIGKFNDEVNGAIAAANAAIKEGNEKMIPKLKKQAETAIKTIQGNLNATDEEISAAYENLAAAIDGLEKISSELPQIAEKEGQSTSGDIVSYITGLFSGNPRVNTQKVTDASARLSSLWSRINQQRNGTNDNGGGNDKPRGPYGNYDKRVDPYEQWDANALVKRREDMLMRVRALAEGTDVQTVLSMDKRFMDEATRKGIKNMRDAIAWYNEERLKIQEVLHSRNLTNEGQWMDPKKGRSRKPKTPESEEAIAELDRYYLERKERIEEARANEEMTEAEYNRRLDALEQEHLERRSALRQTFTSKDKQFIQQFRQWWASVEELDEVAWDTIEAEWLAAFDRDRKYNNRAAQKDLTQMQAIVVKQLREIEAIIDKERPFNGITRNLQDNLTKMGLLFKDGVPEGDKFMQENTRRLTFLLHEAENAYNMTFDQLAEDMRKNGLGAWADAITGSENAEKEKRAVIAQLHEVYDAVQEAIKKEASLVKKQVDITWNDALLPNGKSIKQTYEAAISQLGIREGSVSRANSLIGAGTASQRVADRLAIRQMQMQLAMQEHYYNLVRQTGLQRIDDLKEQARLRREQGKMDEADRMELDAQHATMSLNLSLSKEQTELDKQREEIIARTEESQNRLYTSLREWADLLSSSVQSLFEASHAGEAEYYNELAKLNLTGKGGPGAGTYVVIDNEGTENATAHYEYLSERGAIERELEIERQNAMADAWRKVMDDLNAKMNDQITDWMNAALQNQSIDANTNATLKNTEAIAGLTNAIAGNSSANDAGAMTGAAVPTGDGALSPAGVQEWTEALGTEPWLVWEQTGVSAMQHVQQVTADTSKRMTTSTQSAFAKMTQAANLYGIAYSAMSNDNLSTTQKFEMIAVQSAGQAAISMLTADLAAGQAKNTVQLPGILGKLLGEMPPPVAMATFAIVSGLLGGLMGIAVSKVTKSKAQIAQATGAGGANAGRLTTGMLTYATGNVNEFTDPSTLTPGRTYNVDAADGKTYRAKYTGRNPKTHITNGPEFHLAGEAGREMIIDAGTTRQITMNDTEIWHAIQTLSGGGRMRLAQRQGVRAFADGNIADFEDSALSGASNGMTPEQMMAFQMSLDRNNELLERALTNGIKAVNKWDGPDGIPNMYNRMEKEARRHGVKYL